MTDASSAKPVEFKGGTLTVTSALLRETEPARLADALHVMLGGMPDFFSGETLVLDFSALSDPPERIDWTGLLSLLRRYQTQPVAVRHLPEHLSAAARQAGLAILGDDALRPSAARPMPEPLLFAMIPPPP
ncbi:MAG: septum site-determining protein MinC, partial [Rhodocyclaceae bacterium]|nr:septum site-determining protein MinC [Rhodocyclaceae bacterium]